VCYLFPPFQDILGRLFRTRRDDVIFGKLCLGYYDWEAKKLIKQYRRSNRHARLELLKRQSESASETLPKYQGKDWHTIVLEALWETIENEEISTTHRDIIFGHSDDEYALYGPLGRSLRKQRLRVLDTYVRKDLPCGNPDLIAIKKRWGRSPLIIAVDAKANVPALHNFYHQAYMYYEGFDRVYLATTGWIAAIEPQLKEELYHLGAGLIYVDLTSRHSKVDMRARGGCRNKEIKKQILEAIGWQ